MTGPTSSVRPATGRVSRAPFRYLARNAQSGLLDTFMVSAVLAVLTIRVYLKAAHYPQVGGRGLHVAHVLWGGLGMMVAIVFVLAFLGSRAQRLAAVTGGIGFGAFVDELGKFVTADNNYFFKPTAAMIYTIFVVLFLATREIRRVRKLSPGENLVNAVELSKDLALGGLTRVQRDRALELLAGADPAHPMVRHLRAEFLEAGLVDSAPSPIAAAVRAGERRYEAMVRTRWFHRAIAVLFILQAVALVLVAVAVIAFVVAILLGAITTQAATSRLDPAGPGTIIEAVSSLISGGFTVVGVLALRRDRLRAYRWFEAAVLVGLLLAQPFTLLSTGFAGLVEVFIDLLLLVTLRYMILLEHRVAARSVDVPGLVGVS